MPNMASLLTSSGGPFVSGTTHKLLQLGQPISLTTQAEQQVSSAGKKRKLRVAADRQASEEPSDINPSPAGPTSSTKSKGGSSPTLHDMIQAGVLHPGRDNATVTYKGVTYSASLQANGTILFRGTEFSTPSAFSVYVKRLVTPNKQGDDGWHSVSIDGIMLHHLRLRYQQQQQQQQQQAGQQQVAARPPLPIVKQKKQQKPKQQQQQQQHSKQQSSQGTVQQQQQKPPPPQAKQQQQQQGKQQLQQPPPGKKLKLGKVSIGLPKSEKAAGVSAGAAAAGAGAGGGGAVKSKEPSSQAQAQRKPASAGQQGVLHWVQCSRCEVYRAVPEQHWPQVEADKRSEFFCEDAWWDVTKMEPFSPACLSDVWAEEAEGVEG